MADSDHTVSALALEDLVIPQGASESGTWPTPWLYAEGDPLGVPAGWPGSWVGRLEIRDFYGPGSTVLATLHSDDPDADGVLTLDTETADDDVVWARVTPAVDPVVSAAWGWADTPGCVWDLELVSGVRVIRLVEGGVWLSAEATTDA